jgi:GNAT superfamily N-acetyltransferase
MDDARSAIVIRRLLKDDVGACFDMRREAFRQVFSLGLGPDAVLAGADAYDMDAFGHLLRELETFVAEAEGGPVGFCTVRVLDENTIELLYLYVRLDHHKEGIGHMLVRHAEAWVRQHHAGVSTMVLDTIVPWYNQAFWEKMGYTKLGAITCKYPERNVPGVRLAKNMSRAKT